jgi:hypothetical protein
MYTAQEIAMGEAYADPPDPGEYMDTGEADIEAHELDEPPPCYLCGAEGHSFTAHNQSTRRDT